MPSSCEMLSIAGQNFVTATQRAEMDNYDHASRKHLIRASKDILEGTLKVPRIIEVKDTGKSRI